MAYLNSDVFEIESAKPHKTSVVICLKCFHRWVSVRPENTLLKKLECPQCNLIGYTIETGEVIEQ
jgi:hypothetical protein